MWFRSWLRAASSSERTPARYRSWAPRRIHVAPRLLVERLEDRCVPSAVAANPREVTVMSQNLYVGADIGKPIAAVMSGNPVAIFNAVTQFWQGVQATRFSERAAALAKEIDNTLPDLIGL